MTLLHFSASANRKEFDALSACLAQEMDADLILSASGYPAQTDSIIGIRPTAELIFEESTTPDDVKRFCFDSPSMTLGYISYTYGMMLRGITSDKPLDFPLGHLKKYAAVVEFDDESGILVVSGHDQMLLDEIRSHLHSPCDIATVKGRPTTSPTSSLGQAEYEAGVRTTLEQIRSGYTYQLNLSTQLSWECPDLNPLALFLELWQGHPAPFYVWFNSGQHKVLSTSPERFLQVQNGRVLSQPIKGTLHFDKYSAELAEQLTKSPKEDAELSMIVDLIRNDISANCEYGSVRVDNHKSVFAVDNLLQMYSDVSGKLRSDRDCLDLFFDAFPGGSVTGCPKRSSMEIIEELEPHSRGVYCGSMVIIRDQQNMDSSITIRTGVYDTESKQLHTYAGSGIVVDSDPAKEYQETMAKAEKFLTMRTL